MIIPSAIAEEKVTDGKKIFVSDAYNYRIQIFNITE